MLSPIYQSNMKEFHYILSSLDKKDVREQKFPREVDTCRNSTPIINHIRHIINVKTRYRITIVRKGQATIGNPFPNQLEMYIYITNSII